MGLLGLARSRYPLGRPIGFGGGVGPKLLGNRPACKQAFPEYIGLAPILLEDFGERALFNFLLGFGLLEQAHKFKALDALVPLVFQFLEESAFEGQAPSQLPMQLPLHFPQTVALQLVYFRQDLVVDMLHLVAVGVEFGSDEAEHAAMLLLHRFQRYQQDLILGAAAVQLLALVLADGSGQVAVPVGLELGNPVEALVSGPTSQHMCTHRKIDYHEGECRF